VSDRPLLSIIVPVYNSEKYLARCLDSILAQTFKNFECILVDDGSVDQSPAICDEYAGRDGRIQVLHKNNEGVSAARNDGIQAACGGYIAFVDSDDTVHPEMYRLLIEKIENEKTDVVCCGYSHKNKDYIPQIDLHGESIAQIVYDLENIELFGLIWNKLYTAKIINENRVRFPTGYYFGEDMFFNLQYFCAINSASVVDKALYIYCENSASISKIRPSFDQSLARFKNNSSQIIRLQEDRNGQYVNRILAFDFTYTVFLVRSLYHHPKMAYKKRNEIVKSVKQFYRAHPAARNFRSARYAIFYYSMMFLPFFIFDIFVSVLFT